MQEHLEFNMSIEMIADMARCLGRVHASGKVHADFKPLNGMCVSN
jgi:hypothetical protein